MSNYILLNRSINYKDMGEYILVDLEKKYKKSNLLDYILVDNIDNTDNKNFKIGKNEFLINRICMISKEKYLIDLSNSFSNKENIEHQLKVDIPRCNIKINKKKCVTLKDFNNIINNHKICSFPKKIDEIKMMCSQALYGLPIQILQSTLPYTNYSIGGSNRINIKLNIDEEYLIKSKIIMNIVKFDNQNNVVNTYKILIDIEISSKNDNILISFKTKN